MPTDKASKATKARVLVAVTIGDTAYQPNDVAVFDAATLKTNADALDADPAAVKYAESLNSAE